MEGMSRLHRKPQGLVESRNKILSVCDFTEPKRRVGYIALLSGSVPGTESRGLYTCQESPNMELAA